jgi:hypothetical protein
MVLFVFWPRSDRITPGNYECIHSGMTRDEVEAVLGAPGDHSSGPAVGEDELWWRLRFQLLDRGWSESTWIGDSAFITVTYENTPSGIVVKGSTYQPMEQADVGLFARFLWRAKRQLVRCIPMPKDRTD